MNILLSLPAYHPRYGGPFFSVGALASALVARGHRVTLLTASFPDLPAREPPEGVALEVLPARRIPGVGSSWMPGVRIPLNEVFERVRPDVVHDNGLWLSLNRHVARVANERGVPLIHSPRGCLDPWALSYRSWKKKLAMALYQRRALEQVSCFHAASELEAESIRKMGLRQSIVVIPNGIEVERQKSEDGGQGRGDRRRERETCSSADPATDLPSGDRKTEVRSVTGGAAQCHGGVGGAASCGGQTEQRFDPSSDFRPLTSAPRNGMPYALYLGRLHPIKNLAALVRAWAMVKPEGWCLKLVGSDEAGYRAELESLAKELGISNLVKFQDPEYGEAKWEIIRGAYLSFLVSHSENFGISAAEALGCGVPVIASKTTPWECLEAEKMGWWVEGTPEGIAGALMEAVGVSDMERSEMGRRARAYVIERYSWDAVSEDFVRMYDGLLGG